MTGAQNAAFQAGSGRRTGSAVDCYRIGRAMLAFGWVIWVSLGTFVPGRVGRWFCSICLGCVRASIVFQWYWVLSAVRCFYFWVGAVPRMHGGIVIVFRVVRLCPSGNLWEENNELRNQ